MIETIAVTVGYPPNGIQPQVLPESIVSDPILGWRHRPGSYRYVEEGRGASRAFNVTYREDGSRICEAPSDSSRPYVGLIGCSFIEGFGLDDADTLGVRLQGGLPSYSVENFGVAGYGTYQSLLMLRQIAFRYQNAKGSVVVYGFADFHSLRNIASPLLQRTWQGQGIFPVCDEDHCFYWEGKRMSRGWRMSRTLSLVENALDSIKGRLNQESAERVTRKLLLELRDETSARGIRFIIAPMTPVSPPWDSFFDQNKFEVAPCFAPEFKRREFKLSDGHPNATWMERYGACLSEFIMSSSGH